MGQKKKFLGKDSLPGEGGPNTLQAEGVNSNVKGGCNLWPCSPSRISLPSPWVRVKTPKWRSASNQCGAGGSTISSPRKPGMSCSLSRMKPIRRSCAGFQLYTVSPRQAPEAGENNLFAPRVYSISSSTSTGRKKMWAGIVHMVDICHILVHIPLHLFSIRSVLMEGLSAHIHQC